MIAQTKILLEERRFDDINIWMSTGLGTELPEVLQGIYFMDGNKLPEDCVTLSANAQWDSDRMTLFLRLFDPLQWTFENSQNGRILFNIAKFVGLTAELQFKDRNFRRVDFVPTILGLQLPTWILAFEMNQTEDSRDGSQWYRGNRGFFRLIPLGGYILRKIIDKNGQKTPAFEDMLTKVKETCLVATKNNF